MERNTLCETDDLFRAFLSEQDEARSDELLGVLICKHALPIIKQIIRSKFYIRGSGSVISTDREYSEDLTNEVIVQLLRRLRDLKSKPCCDAPTDFRSYLAKTTYNAFHGYLRQRYPERNQLRNKIRYILTHKPGLALWRGETDELVCGLAAWQDAARLAFSGNRLQQLAGSVQAAELSASLRRDSNTRSPAVILTLIFNRVGGPVRFEDIVDLAAGHTAERRVSSDYEPAGAALAPRSDFSSQIASREEHRRYLIRLWAEIKNLTLEQRTALLLNLRDESGNDMITLLSHLRIASLRQIAETLAMTAEDLAGIWHALPLKDAAIARRISVTTRQVISLRLSARRRLSRRLREFDSEDSPSVERDQNNSAV